MKPNPEMNIIFRESDNDVLCEFETSVFPLKIDEVIKLFVANPNPSKWPGVTTVHGHYKIVGIDHSWEKIYPHNEQGTIKMDLTTFVTVEKTVAPE